MAARLAGAPSLEHESDLTRAWARASSARASPRLPFVKRAYRITGLFASFLAIAVASGGHWMVLQSVAWTRMLIANAQNEPLAAAVRKTFDGRHPCKMCHQIREGRDHERRESSLASRDEAPRVWLAFSAVPPQFATTPHRALAAAASYRPAEFVAAPPEPPPRWA